MYVLTEDIRYMHPRLQSDCMLWFFVVFFFILSISPLHLTRAVTYPLGISVDVNYWGDALCHG